LMGKKDVAKARVSFEKAVALQPAYFPAVQNLAQLDVLDKKPELAKKRLEAVLEKDKKNAQAMVALATLALSNGKKEETTTWLEMANKENPEAVEPARLLVTHYMRLGEKEKALALAKKLQGATPNSPDFLELLGQTQLALGDKAAALDAYGKLAVVLPDSAPVQYRIGSIHMAMQNESAATDSLKKALRLDPNFVDAQAALAGLEAKNGNYTEALAIARQVQKQQSKLPAGFILEGDVLMMQKNAASAVKAYEQAAAINKSNVTAIKIHKALTEAGKAKEADAGISQWLKEHPTDSMAHMYVGEVNLQAKHNKVAIDQFQAVVQSEPNNVAALNNLALAYDEEKDPRALDTAEKAYKLAAESPAVIDTLAWMLVEHGNTARGLPLLQKAVTLAPDSMEIRYHLALALVKTGDKVKARKELEQLVSVGKSFAKMDDVKTQLKQL
jgi:putative PEP-CTERM system TPR-repeat lipoprotein